MKYGGSSLADEDRIQRALSAVAAEASKGTRIAVIVSAMGKTTDQLLRTAKQASNGRIDKGELDDILSMGERTSIRIFAPALKARNVESRYIDPSDPDWPIITDDNFSDANPILEKCEERVKQYVLPLVDKGIIPIIAGFVGRTQSGRITTLGRGGSDTTAFIISKALGADELILVTDAEGIMSADPKVINKPKRLPVIDMNTLVGLADSGTKFIHVKALRYKDASIRVRVINHAYGDLGAEGTVIEGGLSGRIEVTMASQSPVMSITIVGRGISDNPELILELTGAAKEVNVHPLGVSLNSDSAILYLPESQDANPIVEKIHETILKHQETLAMSVRKQLAFLKVRGAGLEDTPGFIGRTTEALRVNSINVFGLLTITSSILLFVGWNDREKALSLIKGALGGV